MFNPTEQAVDVAVDLDDYSGRAHLTDLEGNPGNPVTRDARGHHVTVRPKQIVTVQVNE